MPPAPSATVSGASRRFDSGGPTLADIGEAQLLRQLVEIARQGAGASAEMPVAAGDDAAVWAPPGGADVVLSQDAIVEGEDFLRSWTDPWSVGERALQVALSDLAGMGARPRLCLATLCAAPSTCAEDVLALQSGLCAAAAATGCLVAGGDVSATRGPLVVDVCVVGLAASGRALRRDRGRPGDALVVTGTLGGAAAGLRTLLGELKPPPSIAARWVDRQLRPSARLDEGLALVEAGVLCAGDLSDGLLVDVGRITEASGCAAELWLDRLPTDPELRAALGAAWADAALGGGEDFELVAAVPPALLTSLLGAWPPRLRPLSVVGRLGGGSGTRVLDSEGGGPVAVPEISSRHFRQP
jgi:thiamine-monophosphate kinase